MDLPHPHRPESRSPTLPETGAGPEATLEPKRSTGTYVSEFSLLLACKTTTPACGSTRWFNRVHQRPEG